MSQRVNRVLSLLPVLLIVTSLIGLEWATRAQTPANQNQSPNTDPKNGPMPEAAPTKPRTSKTNKRKPRAADTAATVSPPENTSGTTQTTSSAEAQTSQSGMKTAGATSKRRRRGRNTTPSSTAQNVAVSEQTDLSGTYSGTMNCPDAGVTGDTTLTVTSDQFTLADGKSGRISVATTRGYTAVAMHFGDATGAGQPGSQVAATTPKTVSFRARKSGDRLTLSPVSGGSQCSFMPAGSMARSRKRRGNAMKQTVTGEQVTNPGPPTVTEPATTPAPTAPTPSPTPPRK
jgi:hypothetical protein